MPLLDVSDGGLAQVRSPALHGWFLQHRGAAVRAALRGLPAANAPRLFAVRRVPQFCGSPRYPYVPRWIVLASLTRAPAMLESKMKIKMKTWTYSLCTCGCCSVYISTWVVFCFCAYGCCCTLIHVPWFASVLWSLLCIVHGSICRGLLLY